MKFTKMALAASLIAGASFANAGDIKYGLQIGHAKGGDNLGDSANRTSSDAGDGDSIGVFAIIPVSGKELSIKVAANYLTKKGHYTTGLGLAAGGKIKFTRLPIDVLLIKKINKLQLGAGLTYHLKPQAKVTSSEKPTTTNGNNVLGLALEANYQFYSNDSLAMDIGARYTNIKYTFDSQTRDYDGSNLAITAGITF